MGPQGTPASLSSAIHSALGFCRVTGMSTSMITSRFVERALAVAKRGSVSRSGRSMARQKRE